MIKLTVNELPVEVEQGSTVLEAVQKAGFNPYQGRCGSRPTKDYKNNYLIVVR